MIAFSYGKNPDVNIELAQIVEKAMTNIAFLHVFMQWEIAKHF